MKGKGASYYTHKDSIILDQNMIVLISEDGGFIPFSIADFIVEYFLRANTELIESGYYKKDAILYSEQYRLLFNGFLNEEEIVDRCRVRLNNLIFNYENKSDSKKKTRIIDNRN